MNDKGVAKEKNGGNGRYWWRQQGEAKCNQPQPKPGDLCPNCHKGKLAFDGLFILVCGECQHIADSGGFT